MHSVSLVFFSSLLLLLTSNSSFSMMEKEIPDPLQIPRKATLKPLAKKNDAKAQYELGMKFYSKKDYKPAKLQMAIYWLGKAAENDYTLAQIFLSDHYLKECQQADIRGMDEKNYLNDKKDAKKKFDDFKNNFENTMKFAKLASQKNGLEAQDIIGQLYECFWREETDEMGNPYWVPQEAIKSITGFKNGRSEITLQASYWYRLAADQGLPDAQFHLGRLYDKNKRDRNPIEAVSWYGKAARQGHKEAREALKKFVVPNDAL